MTVAPPTVCHRTDAGSFQHDVNYDGKTPRLTRLGGSVYLPRYTDPAYRTTLITTTENTTTVAPPSDEVSDKYDRFTSESV